MLENRHKSYLLTAYMLLMACFGFSVTVAVDKSGHFKWKTFDSHNEIAANQK